MICIILNKQPYVAVLEWRETTMKKVLALLAAALLVASVMPTATVAKPISVGGSDIGQWGHYDLYTAKFIATAAIGIADMNNPTVRHRAVIIKRIDGSYAIEIQRLGPLN